MKRIFLLLAIILAPIISLAQGINALYSFSTFDIPSKKPYVEINTSIDAKSLSYVNNEAIVELVVIIQQDSSVLYVEKRDIKVNKTDDNTSIIDIQRVELDNGKYVAIFEFKDKNLPNTQPLRIEDNFEINYTKDQVNISSVQLIDSFQKTTTQNIRSKNGVDLVPYLFDAVTESKNKVTYYAEIYNSDKQFGKDAYYIVSVVLENISTGKKVEEIQKIKREKASQVNVVMGTLDIEKLPQGNYYLVVEVRDGKNILYAYNRTAFRRYSKIKEQDQTNLPPNAFVHMITEKDIDENMYCLMPIASESQKSYIKQISNNIPFEEKKFFLYNFWRNINPENPNGEWEHYMKEVEYVNSKYSTNIKKGYETEMGRVYLVYGKPDYVIDEKFKSSSGIRSRTAADKAGNPYATNTAIGAFAYMPYQIWKYKKTPFGEVNKGFVFYALQNNLMEYYLLHSDAKGEPFDYNWESRLARGHLPEGVEGEAGIQFRRGY
jgi:GWxTD domain-containing protein